MNVKHWKTGVFSSEEDASKVSDSEPSKQRYCNHTFNRKSKHKSLPDGFQIVFCSRKQCKDFIVKSPEEGYPHTWNIEWVMEDLEAFVCQTCGEDMIDEPPWGARDCKGKRINKRIHL